MTELSVPPELQAKSQWAEHVLRPVQSHPLAAAAAKLLITSEYGMRQQSVLLQLMGEEHCLDRLEKSEYRQQLDRLVSQATKSAFGAVLRAFRHRHLLRIVLRQLGGLSDTADSMQDWSDCADILILCALEYCLEEVRNAHGALTDAQGSAVTLLPLAMGKLGGRELNFSSDVDLIFFCTAAGTTEDGLDHVRYYARVVHRFVQLLQQSTEDGFVFRVDLRLRPYGESGPLVSTLASMESYYQEQGRDWERYAMVKARAPGDCPEPPWLRQLIKPFVYRRYVDFGVIESLRGMKAMMTREIHQNPLLDDIKRGQGGIREFEFVVQSFQLIRGGRLPALQHTGALEALETIRQEGWLGDTQSLREAYLFLRTLENALQVYHDHQTHALPKDNLARMRIAYALGESDWEAVAGRLRDCQDIIHQLFSAQLFRVGDYEDEQRMLSSQLLAVWQGHAEEQMAVNVLNHNRFANAKRCYQLLHDFRHGPRCKRLSQAARLRLDRFMVLLLQKLSGTPDTDSILTQVIRLLEQTVARSAYLALLTENPQALEALLSVFYRSPWLAERVTNHPFLLETLLEDPGSPAVPSLGQLRRTLQQCLAASGEDAERREEILREFRLSGLLRVARAELEHAIHAEQASCYISRIAEVLLGEVLELAVQSLESRYPRVRIVASRLAILAYGKLGSLEMHYTSDLDLVFLHTVPCEDVSLLTRLVQKVLHMLTTRLQTGVLYAVDTRLRPSGSSGLLVSTMDAFEDYQINQAWVWEHQALLRARVIVGSKSLQKRFLAIKTRVLGIWRDDALLREEVTTMRRRMAVQNQEGNPILNAPGGVVDIEFLVQYLVLAHALSDLALVTNTRHLIRKLAERAILDRSGARLLRHALLRFHTLLHAELLSGTEPTGMEVLQQEVSAVYARYIPQTDRNHHSP